MKKPKIYIDLIPFACALSASLIILSSPFAMADSAMSGVTSDQRNQKPLSLQEAMFYAVQTHPVVMSKKNEFSAAVHGLESAKWHRFPSVSAQTTAGQFNTGPVTSMTLEQPLWTGGRITADIASSTARAEGAEASIIEAEQQILTRTASAFSEMIRLQTRLEASQESIDEHQRLLALIDRRAKSEISPHSEVVMAKARLEQARSERLQLQTLFVNAKEDLEQLTSEPVSILKVPVVDLELPNNLEQTIQIALQNSPAIKRLTFEMQASESDIDAKRATLMPQLSVRYQQFWGGNYPPNMVYLAVGLQPGGGLSALSNIKQAESKRGAAEAIRDTSRKDIADSLRTDWYKVQSARAEVEIFKELVESTREVYESAVRQYAAGRKSWVEVLNFRKEATQARYALADSQWGGFLSAVRIKINTGYLAEHMLNLEGGALQ
jgi:outer membrane protein, adhesin transport system